jgi:hypothetical protein
MTEQMLTITGATQNYYIGMCGSPAMKRGLKGGTKQGEGQSCDRRG